MLCQASDSIVHPLPSFPRRRESNVFGFGCFWVSGNFQIVIPTKVGIQTIGRRKYSKVV
ncbi:hypothetical protein NMA510612_2044 [Neisseria meningitidis]|uniref:Uncharacterized protein n=2 Tax=Neisseria meningitidis TaxID=487 RepID=X5FAU9_NEIME|nr:hypothetical protein NMA510612_2044 [Neisseria meningitidis]CBA08397.1 hypothetical protein predicted by Glimmer/Critica [Neisseria meningitidis alpha275]